MKRYKGEEEKSETYVAGWRIRAGFWLIVGLGFNNNNNWKNFSTKGADFACKRNSI